MSEDNPKSGHNAGTLTLVRAHAPDAAGLRPTPRLPASPTLTHWLDCVRWQACGLEKSKQHHVKKARTVAKEADEEQYKQSEIEKKTKDRG